jgi:hypothetical protein
MARSEERAARNEVLFREANEKISRTGDELDFPGKIPFLCECEEPTCSQIVRLESDEYERARSSARQFVVAPGHETREANTIESNERFMIVEKLGVAAEIAEDADPRTAK